MKTLPIAVARDTLEGASVTRTVAVATAYPMQVPPLNFRRLGMNCNVVTSATGDFAFVADEVASALTRREAPSDLRLLAELKSKFVVMSPSAPGQARLFASRLAAKKETVEGDPSLHIIVPTLQCGHSCPYCQVSRAMDSKGFTISLPNLEAACDSILESKAERLTVEFQGGDPLLQFDLIRHAIDRIVRKRKERQQDIRFVVASTLHQLTPEICEYLKSHQVFLSTSIDGPSTLHNRNRPTPSGDSFQRTVAGISMARELIGADSVSALMTTTRHSLPLAHEIVDIYVELGLQDIFIRPLAPYGFAARTGHKLGYSREDFYSFYAQALERVLHWNRQGAEIREVWASIALNKMLAPLDGGYVDLQSPTGAGSAVLVYNYDGYVYPSDEARMLAESGDKSLAMGAIGTPLSTLMNSEVRGQLIANSLSREHVDCRDCAYNPYCGPDPIAALAQHGAVNTRPSLTTHCQDSLWLFDYLFARLKTGDTAFERLARRWAQPTRRDRA